MEYERVTQFMLHGKQTCLKLTLAVFLILISVNIAQPVSLEPPLKVAWKSSIWTQYTEEIRPPYIGLIESDIIFMNYYNLQAIDANDGKLLWKKDWNGGVAYEDGILYAAGDNPFPISLRYPYSTEYELNSIGIMSNFGFKVAESEILRFLVERESKEYRNYERRGAVYTESNPVLAWDGLNFGGFLYDLDSGNYSEMLEITNLSGRTIPAHSLKFTAFVTDIPYSVTKKTGIRPAGTNGSYKAVVFGAEKYAAVEGNSSKLAKILVDNGTNIYENKILLDGEIWNLGSGYNLTVKSVNASSSPRRSQLVLSKNGVELDEKWISMGSAYTYTRKNSSGENDLPVFVTYLHSVFTGEAGPNLIELRYTWLLSDNITEIKTGERFGVFSAKSLGSDFILLENEQSINLSAGSCINLMGNFGFVIADSNELRFYPSEGKKCDQSG